MMRLWDSVLKVPNSSLQNSLVGKRALVIWLVLCTTIPKSVSFLGDSTTTRYYGVDRRCSRVESSPRRSHPTFSSTSRPTKGDQNSKAMSIPQPIVGFHLDEEGDWAAKLKCGHNHHVRHNPPMMERPWVLTEEGRTKFLGYPLNCKLCVTEAAEKKGQAR